MCVLSPALSEVRRPRESASWKASVCFQVLCTIHYSELLTSNMHVRLLRRAIFIIFVSQLIAVNDSVKAAVSLGARIMCFSNNHPHSSRRLGRQHTFLDLRTYASTYGEVMRQERGHCFAMNQLRVTPSGRETHGEGAHNVIDKWRAVG